VKSIILYGHLAKTFGRHHRFDVRTPAEAVRALQANFPTFKSHMIQHSEPGYHVRVGKDYRDEEGLHYPIDGTIKIVPAIGGAGAVGKIILGAALIIAAPYAAGWLFANTAMVGLATAVASFAPSIGLSLVLGGISQVLFKPPTPTSVEKPENKPSFNFDGPVNTVAQGNAVPVCYGRLLVGSQVVSASLETGDIAL
jgi:predicted phage tail protein